MKLSYPDHFLLDIEGMTPFQRRARGRELIAWAKRHADGQANPKWVRFHMYELSRLLEIVQEDIDKLAAAE